MISEFQFGTRVLRPAVAPESAGAADIGGLDAADEVPLAAGLWFDGPGGPNGSLSDRDAVRRVREVTADGRRTLYRVTYGSSFDGVDVYRSAVEHGGVFVSGRAGGSAWTLRMRFPDREAVGGFREECASRGLDVSVESLHEDGTVAGAETYGLTEPQRRALVTAAEGGYFEVPRRTSLSGLAGDLDVSSQAASERIRRGLDSLVAETLLEPTDDPTRR